MILLILLFLLLLPSVLAETCPRGSLTFANGQVQRGPIIITQPGNYCLDDNIHVNYNWAQQYGTSVIVVQSRDVSINLNGNSITNEDGSSWLHARWAPIFTAIELSDNSPIVGDIQVANGEIVGFDQGIYEVTLGSRGQTDEIIVRNMEFIDNSNSIYTAPKVAYLTKNYFQNNYPNAIIAWGLTVQYADQVEIVNNYFFNLMRPINVDFSRSVLVSDNYLDNPNLNLRTFSKGVFMSTVSKALIKSNKIKHFNYGLEARYNSKVKLLENYGCDVSIPITAQWNSYITEQNNVWLPSC